MVEQSFNVTLKLNHDDGTIISARLLKARSKLPEDILEKLNSVLSNAFDKPTIPTMTSVGLGNLAEEVVLSHLRTIEAVNQDFSVSDTSSLTGHGDISVETQGVRICIEIKNYTKPVPSKELDKFHQSVSLPDYQAGVIIQMNPCGFARERSIKTPIDIRFTNGKPIAYITAVDNALIYPILIALISMTKQSSSDDLQSLVDERTRRLIDVHERAKEMKVCIEAQKKSVARMETLLNETLALSLI